jgi:hypothetical protein
MEILMKKVETYKIDTMENAEKFVETVKKDPDHDGYEVKSYKIVKKEKKSKGEIIDEWYVVEVSKVWND